MRGGQSQWQTAPQSEVGQQKIPCASTFASTVTRIRNCLSSLPKQITNPQWSESYCRKQWTKSKKAPAGFTRSHRGNRKSVTSTQPERYPEIVSYHTNKVKEPLYFTSLTPKNPGGFFMKTITEIINAIESTNPRSAWNKGVKAYRPGATGNHPSERRVRLYRSSENRPAERC